MDKTSETGRAPANSTPSIHEATIRDQFSRQAALFAKTPELHGEDVLSLLIDAAQPKSGDLVLDVACGPGSIVSAFAPRVQRAIGLDTTEAMLRQARNLAAKQGLTNVEWHLGDAYSLPFPDATLDIVTCRFAFHHLQHPEAGLREMKRVCRPGGKIVVCDGIASADPAKASAFNAMELLRDPSTVRFLPLAELLGLYGKVGLATPIVTAFQVPTERDALVDGSFPEGDDRETLRAMITKSADGDTMGLGALPDGETVRFSYPSIVVVAKKEEERT